MRALELFQEQEELEAFQREALRAMEEFRLDCICARRNDILSGRPMNEQETFQQHGPFTVEEAKEFWESLHTARCQDNFGPGTILCPCMCWETIQEETPTPDTLSDSEPDNPLTGVLGQTPLPLSSTADRPLGDNYLIDPKPLRRQPNWIKKLGSGLARLTIKRKHPTKN